MYSKQLELSIYSKATWLDTFFHVILSVFLWSAYFLDASFLICNGDLTIIVPKKRIQLAWLVDMGNLYVTQGSGNF